MARIADERLYRLRALQFGALLVLIPLLALWLGVLAFPRALLALLGQHYSGLTTSCCWWSAAPGSRWWAATW